MDSAREPAFDRFTQLAANLLDAPIALISLVDEHRQFFKSAVGLPEPAASARQIPLTFSICQHVVSSRKPLVVSDARIHYELREYRAVQEFGVVAYAGIPLLDDHDRALGALCVIDVQPRDFSERDVAILRELAAAVMIEIKQRDRRDALQESDSFYRAVFDGIDVGLLTFDLSRRVIWANSSAEWMFGYAPGELAGMRLFDLLDPADREPERTLHGELTDRSRTRVTHERKMKRKDGSLIWVRRTLSAVPSDSMRKGVVLASIEDIQEPKQLATQLQQHELRYRALVRNLPRCAILSFDRELRHTTAEGHVDNEGNVPASTAIGKTIREISSTSSNGRKLEQAYRAALRGEKSVVEVLRDGRYYTFHVAPEQEGGGLTLVYDSTTTRRATEQLEAQVVLFDLLQQLAREVSQPGDGRTILRACLAILCRELDYPVAHVYACQGDALISTDVWQLDDALRRRPLVGASPDLRLGGCLAGRAAQQRQPIVLPDLMGAADFTRGPAALASGLRAGLAVPLTVGGAPAAVIEAFADRVRPPTPTLIEALNIVAGLLGPVCERVGKF